jgi:hypothetical protein
MPPFDVAERLARDLYIATAMAGQFETYLVENELFWPLSGNLRGGMPRLTVGGFLLRLHRLDGLHAHMDADQQARYADAKRAFQHGREQWTIHFYGKIDREWEMRVNLLGNFLADCDDRAITGCIANWPNQATQRTILHLLLVESQRRDPSPTAKKADLARLDRDLRRYLLEGESGAFLWQDGLAPVFPEDPFWWLWVAPPDDTEPED